MKPFHATVLFIGILVGGCVSKGERTRSEGIEYAPQMYHSIPLEPYSQTDYNPYTKDGKNAMEPVQGTIARGNLDYIYPYPNTFEGYEAAGRELKNPLPFTMENVEEGKRLYTHFCIHCHGEKGDGQGTIVQAGKFPPPPAYNGPLKDLPEGKMFHSITYGKNLMGSHASQLTPRQRWLIIHYIKLLQRGITDPKVAFSDTTLMKELASTEKTIK